MEMGLHEDRVAVCAKKKKPNGNIFIDTQSKSKEQKKCYSSTQIQKLQPPSLKCKYANILWTVSLECVVASKVFSLPVRYRVAKCFFSYL